MPKFSYVAMDSRGKETKGTLDVADQTEALNRLKDMGYFPMKVVEVEKSAEKGDKGPKGKKGAPAKGAKKGKEINIPMPAFLKKKVKPKARW